MGIYRLPRVLLFAQNYSGKFHLGVGRSSHILGAKNDIGSVRNRRFCLFFLCSMLLFLDLYGFFTNCNKYKIISGEITCFTLKISVGRVWIFFWCILTLIPLVTLQNVNFRSHHVVVLKLSHDIYWLFFPCFYCLNRSIMAPSISNSEKDQQTASLLQHQYHYQLSSMVFHILQ